MEINNSDSQSSVAKLSLFSLVMITVVSVDSIRNLPATALFGSKLIFFFIVSAILFLIPCALVSAELASSCHEQGGIYAWVKKAFGSKVGFVAIWFQWIENVIWYPTILSFVAGSVGYLIAPSLAASKFFLLAVILTSFWGMTFVNLKGIDSSARFSNFCALTGLLLPMVLIISLGLTWFFSGKTIQIDLSPAALMPSFEDHNIWVALTGIMMSFCGIEIATVHASDVKDPQRTFPRALLYSVIIILSTLVLGSMAIALVIPADQISLVAGIMQAFNAFFTAYHMQWMLPLLALMLVLGGFGAVNNWIIAPTKGLMIAAQDGNLPPVFQKQNKCGAPANLLLYQAIIVSVLSLAFLLLPSVNASYWLLTALAAQLYMLMYILMFAAAIYLRFNRTEPVAGFQIPGGNIGLLCVATMGLIGCLATVIVSFIPPGNIQTGSVVRYESLLLSGLIIMCLPPFIMYYYRKPNWTMLAEING